METEDIIKEYIINKINEIFPGIGIKSYEEYIKILDELGYEKRVEAWKRWRKEKSLHFNMEYYEFEIRRGRYPELGGIIVN